MRICFFLLVYLFLQFPSLAQKISYNIIHYTTDDGLPQNSITGIAFDRKGYCWLGTELGLVRFDGMKFKVFNSNNLKNLQSERIRMLSADANGTIYARNDQWQNIIIDERDKLSSSLPQIFKEGITPLWVVDGIVQEKSIPSKQQHLRSQSNYLVNLPDGNSYYFDDKCLSFIIKDSSKIIDRFKELDMEKQMAVDNMYILFDKHHLKVWKDGQLQKQITEIKGPISANKAYRQWRFTCHQNAGQNYIFTEGTLYKIFLKNGELMSEELLRGLPVRVVSKIYYHAGQHKYYIGSLIDGLYIVSLAAFSYPEQTAEAVKEGFYAQVLTPQGNIICQRFLYRDGKAPIHLGLNAQIGATLFLSPEQQLYYGNEPSLFRFDMTSGVNQKLLDLDSRPSSIYNDQSDANTIIVNTAFGLTKLKGDSVVAAKRIPINNGVIKSIQTGRDSFILATANGVKWYDFNRNNIYRSILDSLYIRAIYAEADGKLWISTYGKGFYLYHHGRVNQLPEYDHKGLLTVHSFIEDGRGNFWLPTNNGLFVVKKSELLDYAQNKVSDVLYYRYSVADNLHTNEFNGGCTPGFIWTKDSMLSLPSIAGLVQFYPNRIMPLWADNNLYIDEMVADNQSLTFSSNTLTLDPDFNWLFLKFSSPYFGSPENLQLEYMVEGLDGQWHRLPASGELSLNRIAAGFYKLFVRRKGESKNEGIYLNIHVNPAFYNRWWFWFLIAIIFATTLLVVLRIRTKRLNARNRKLQAIVAEQTAALKESNRTKDKIITMVLHDLRSPIRFLHIITSGLTKGQLKDKPAEMESMLRSLKNSTGALNEFTDQFFTWAMSQKETFQVVKQVFALQCLFDELYELYFDILAANNNELVIEPGDISVFTDKQILSAIIRNLLDNANKNTTKGRVHLCAIRRGDYVTIEVTDTGNGMSTQAQQYYFNSQQVASQQGHGSVIVVGLLEKINGKLNIESMEGNGTIFRIELRDR